MSPYHKPREFWIDPVDDYVFPSDDKVHVIEYFAYEELINSFSVIDMERINYCMENQKLLDRVQKLREALEKFTTIPTSISPSVEEGMEVMRIFAKKALAQNSEEK